MKYILKINGTVAYENEIDYLKALEKSYIENILNGPLDETCSFKEWYESDDAFETDPEEFWSTEAYQLYDELCEKYNGQYEAWVVMDSENGVISDEYRTKDELLDAFPPLDVEEANATVCRVLCNKGSWLECLEELTPDEL